MSQQKKANIIFGVILIFIVLLSVSLTIYLIIRHNQSVDKDEVTNTEVPIEPYLEFSSVSKKDTIDIYQEYPVNPIDINLVGTVSITGLKDKEIEDKVNSILSELDALENEDDYGCYVNFNVSNVLSITCEEEVRNIDLTTGEEIKFEELFNQDTNMDALIRREAYQYACYTGNCIADIDYGDDYENQAENEMIAFLQDYKNGNITFGIGYTSFNIYRNQEFEWFYFSSYGTYYEDLTIYDRFLTEEDIYEEDITTSCLPQTCELIVNYSDSEDYYQTGEFLNNTNYLEFYIYNSSDFNLAYDEFEKYPFLMDEIGEKVKRRLIEELDLEHIDHYKNMRLNVTIYNNELNGYQLEYNLTSEILDGDHFYASILGDELATKIDEESIYKTDLVMDTSGNLSFLENDPTQLFANFEEVLYQYIIDDLAKAEEEQNYVSDFSNYDVGSCEGSEDFNACYKNRDFHQLIKEANYAIDPINERIHMYQHKPGIGMAASYVSTFLPFSLFSNEEDSANY